VTIPPAPAGRPTIWADTAAAASLMP
jgi:hypothetical protein